MLACTHLCLSLEAMIDAVNFFIHFLFCRNFFILTSFHGNPVAGRACAPGFHVEF